MKVGQIATGAVVFASLAALGIGMAGGSSVASPEAVSSPAPVYASERTSPEALRVPSWGETYDVVPVDLDENLWLIPPDDLATLGWWTGGAYPGQGSGTVTLVVHRDSAVDGRGPFADLENMTIGETVVLDGREYVLEDVTEYEKSELPAEEVFDQTTDEERLVIVTCGGTFDATSGGWDSNVVGTFSAV